MKRLTVSQIAEIVNGIAHGDPTLKVSGPCTLDAPSAGKICFANDIAALSADPTACGAVLLAQAEPSAPFAGAWIAVARPRTAFALALDAMVESAPAAIAASAAIDPSAEIASDVTIGPNCVIGADCSIGARSRLGANVVLGPRVIVGRDVVIGSNTVIGEVGFGLVRTDDDVPLRIPHVGGVRIDDTVEIGALVSIASGTIDPTRVRSGAKIDDHVFIAHNCDIGERVCVIACAEISGSVVVGEDSWIGPNATVRDKITIGAQILVGMGAIVTRDLLEPGNYAGAPAKKLGSLAAHR